MDIELQGVMPEEPVEPKDNDASQLFRKCILLGMEYGFSTFWDEYRKLDRTKDIAINLTAQELTEGNNEDRIKGLLKFLKAFIEKSSFPAMNYVTIKGSEEDDKFFRKIEPNAMNSGIHFEIEE